MTKSNLNGSTSSFETKQIKSLTHHKDYYLVGGDLYIMIDTTIFKIHSYFFRREAKNFYSNIDPKSPGDDTTKGLTENTAIIIENASVREFERFLWIFYNPLYDIYSAAISDWFSILRLAHEWDFPQVKRFALREIKRREDEIDVVQRIVLYRDYKAPEEYLVPLYAELCARPYPPTIDEAEKLGHETTFNIFRAREQIRSDGSVSPLPKGKSAVDTYPTVAEVMGVPEFKPDFDLDDNSKSSNRFHKNSNGRTKVKPDTTKSPKGFSLGNS
ncbi:hypothetical protein CC1G_06811 [Coprinopsis cinerea okayama7|uniref:BTB domain-containing protein n=1 Tax=Coprinopsis cinerea (strain Okayama-7 / 130 / ATCC MYA-4618 / FGSC 9003) TaxID=240176 RepID=A8N1K2_COPC7|nr:hypothetical protein CC1G_06811 [Coprinopsis cinerea okayama7\|eukprot:XP_001828825.2 hypothetical protein CC1G_06811 [Coprinopsis cinerea okayama7\